MLERLKSNASTLGWLVLLFGTALLLAPTATHVDDSDALLYRTIARHMVEDGRWTHLRYVNSVYPEYYEHLPFGFWPLALAVRWFGENSLPFVAALFSFGTMLVVWRTGAPLMGELAGAASLFVLCTTESFIIYGARERLDPALIFFATLAAAAVLTHQHRARDWLLALFAATIAALIKGPFGLVPIATAVIARAWVDRSWRQLFLGGAVTAVAAVPVTAFLIHNHVVGDNTWWQGYVQAQVLASAVGGRSDGFSNFFYPWETIAGRFWPGLPLAGIAIVQSVMAWRRGTGHSRERTMLILTALLSVALLCLPRRKLWHHVIVTFPLWSLAAGAAAGPWLERYLSAPERRRKVLRGMTALAGLMLVASVLGIGRELVPRQCVFSRTLNEPLSRVAAGDPVLLVSNPTNWQALSILAAERRLQPWIETELPLGDDATHHARIALVQLRQMPKTLGPWRELARAEGWVVLEQGSAVAR